MPKLLDIDPTARVVLPKQATGAWVDILWDASWRVAALVAGGPERGKIVLVSGQQGQFMDLAGSAGTPVNLKVAGPVVGDVLPPSGLPYVTLKITPIYPTGVRDPGQTITLRARPHDTSTDASGVWNLKDIGDDGTGPVLVTVAERLAVDAATTAAQAATADLTTKKALIDQSLADSAQSRDALAAIASAFPKSTFSDFPAPTALPGKSAIALDTGAIYTSNGSTWGAPIGYIVTKAQVDALISRVGAVETGQASGFIGYLTLAALNADLAHPAGTVGYVASDATPANNGEYIKLGASGSGSWQPASTSRLALLEARTQGVSSATSTPTLYVNGVPVLAVWSDAGDGVYLYFDAQARPVFPAGFAEVVTAALSVAGALRTEALGSGYVNNAAHVLSSDSTGALALYVDMQGRTNAPGGLVAPNLPDLTKPQVFVNGITFDVLPSGYFTDAVHVLSSDSTGQLAAYVDSKGRLNAPGGIVAPNAVQGVSTDADGGVRINGIRMVPTAEIDCHGNSLTNGTGASSSANRYPEKLAATMGRIVHNLGMGGTTSTAIAARMNAIRTFVTVTGNQIPASGSVVVTSVSTELLTGSGFFFSMGYLAGVYGKLEKRNPDSGNTYTFTRSTAGSATTISSTGELFTPVTVGDLGQWESVVAEQQERIMLLWDATNDPRWLKNPDGSPLLDGSGKAQIDYASMEQALGNVQAMVQRLRVAHRRFGLIELLNGTGEGNDSTGAGLASYNFVIEFNRRLKNLYPGNFIPIRYRLCDPTTGRLKSSLAYDAIHLLDAGYQIVVDEVKAFLLWKGW